ncbi:type II secretion system F family protein [Ideonella sp. BN130291]|uniref:type II secretion system F family protein n=1 Tax=Ideonella sp. BN130291 TaxID=3112940 RepID=UPI002E27012C|nr:type II secretion system F family protein [Ideonella sp. BN130291]
MQRFAYTGRSAAGSVSGTLDGPNASAVADQLLARGVTPLKIQAEGGAVVAATDSPSIDWRALFKQKVTGVDLMLFCRQLNTLLRSGVPILRALLGLQESATNLTFKDTLAEVRRSLESGIELSMSFAQHANIFDHFFVAMVRVGEMTGRLEEVFLRLFKHLEFEVFMRQQVKSALRYPMFVMIAMIGAIAVINVMVIPAFAGVFKAFGAELPLATRILLGTSRFTIDYGWMLLGGAVIGAAAFHHWKHTPAGKLQWDGIQLRIPIAGKIVRKATLARFARSFALALKSGVPVEQALSVVAQTAENAYLAKRIEGMRDSVERGESILRAAIAAGVFTPVVLQMIGVGEETGAVDELMEEVAELYSNEVQYELKTLAQQIEPIMIVFIGILVLILALGVFLPVWDLGRVAFKK